MTRLNLRIGNRASVVFDEIARDLEAIETWLTRDRKVRAVAAHVDRNAGRARRERERQSPGRVASLYDIGGESA